MATTAIADFLAEHETRSTLRFVTCGSVDDGKSTLIGRLLYEANLVLDDSLAALEIDSRKVGTRGHDLDFALLVDGLQAEREQGITIDVAYRYFTTSHRQFIVADTPGHLQYTRNMATGASTADLAVILVDVTKGLMPQTHRHTHLVALMGITQVILAVNKLDLVDFDHVTFQTLAAQYQRVAFDAGIEAVTAIPLSAALGDNLVELSVHTPWYGGPTLLDALETAPVRNTTTDGSFRLPVQWVNRPNAQFRGFAGQVQAGSAAPGDAVVVLPAGVPSRIDRIVTADGDRAHASNSMAVTVTLTDDVDVSRGDVICAADAPAAVTDRFRARLVWMSEQPYVAGRRYHAKIGTATTGATITGAMDVLDVETLAAHATDTLQLNDIGVVEMRLDAPVVVDTYQGNQSLGGFILIDRVTNDTVAAGMIEALHGQDHGNRWQHRDVDGADRATLMAHRGAVVWLTGDAKAGTSTFANEVERELRARGVHTFLLDVDNLRHGICRDLGFSPADRAESIRRAGEVAALMREAGLVVIALIHFPSPASEHADITIDTATHRATQAADAIVAHVAKDETLDSRS